MSTRSRWKGAQGWEMFDFRKSVRRHHSIEVPFHDGFSADRDRYLLRDTGLKSLLKLPATSPKISGPPLD
jgi:hypothetical protein